MIDPPTSRVTLECPHCDARVSAEVRDALIWGSSPDDPVPDGRVSLARCPECHRPLVALENCTGRYIGDDFLYTPPVRAWPSPERESSVSIPAIVQVSLAEAQRCHRAGAHTACAVMCGRALEGVCVHFKTKGNVLAKGLPELRDRKIIDERLLAWGEQLRKHRNLAAHASEERISKEDSTDLLDFVNAICDYVFVLTAKFTAFMARKAPAGAGPAVDATQPAPEGQEHDAEPV